jgi:hypothetical protein
MEVNGQLCALDSSHVAKENGLQREREISAPASCRALGVYQTNGYLVKCFGFFFFWGRVHVYKIIFGPQHSVSCVSFFPLLLLFVKSNI